MRRAAGGGPTPLGTARRNADKELILLKIYDPQQVCVAQILELLIGIQATAERIGFGTLATTVRLEQGNTR